jgi:hypothetical protein
MFNSQYGYVSFYEWCCCEVIRLEEHGVEGWIEPYKRCPNQIGLFRTHIKLETREERRKKEKTHE